MNDRAYPDDREQAAGRARDTLPATGSMRGSPALLRGLIAATATAGSALLVLASLGVAGVGPLGS